MRAQGFGALDGGALVVTTVVGAGIFTVPAYVAQLAGSGAVAVALWLVGGLIAMAGALCYAELASQSPRGGAEYVYIREAFGPAAGFLSGWTSFVAGFSGAVAAAAVGFGVHVERLTRTTRSSAESADMIALALVVLITGLVLIGMKAGKWATNAMAVFVVGLMVVLIVWGVPPHLGTRVSSGGGFRLAALSALVPIFFTYSGWNAAAYVAGEFRNPVRNIPRALIGGTACVTTLYVGLISTRVSEGGFGSGIVGILLLIALASSVCAMMITGPRIYVEMARDGALPALFGRVNGRGVPAAAVLAQSAWTIVLILTGTFEQIVAYTGFAIVVFSGLAVCALFVQRARLGTPSGYKVPGYPLLPGAFVLVLALIAVASFRYAPGPSVAGVGLILVGLPVRAILTRDAGPPTGESFTLSTPDTP